MLCLGDLIIASDRKFLNYVVSLLLLLVKSSYKFYWSLAGVDMLGPRSLPRGGYAWSQVPCEGLCSPWGLGMSKGWELVYQRAGGMYTRGQGTCIPEGRGHVYQRGLGTREGRECIYQRAEGIPEGRGIPEEIGGRHVYPLVPCVPPGHGTWDPTPSTDT